MESRLVEGAGTGHHGYRHTGSHPFTPMHHHHQHHGYQHHWHRHQHQHQHQHPVHCHGYQTATLAMIFPNLSLDISISIMCHPSSLFVSFHLQIVCFTCVDLQLAVGPCCLLFSLLFALTPPSNPCELLWYCKCTPPSNPCELLSYQTGMVLHTPIWCGTRLVLYCYDAKPK